MFYGDKGHPSRFDNLRKNYDVIIDNEKLTLQKLRQNLGFYNIIFEKKLDETEFVFDTDRKLLTSAGLILRKKVSPTRTYFSLVRISSMPDIENREKKYFLGECDVDDEPNAFPVQIADGINKIFNNLFTIDLVDVVKHCTPYIKFHIGGSRYKIVSGTGYEAEMTFETLKIQDLRTGKKAQKRNFSLKLENSPKYAKERQHILDTIEHHCKELVFVKRSRFEIAEVAVRIPEQQPEQNKSKKKKSRKQIEAELAAKNSENPQSAGEQ